jgi:uncharacterized membrane protein
MVNTFDKIAFDAQVAIIAASLTGRFFDIDPFRLVSNGISYFVTILLFLSPLVLLIFIYQLVRWMLSRSQKWKFRAMLISGIWVIVTISVLGYLSSTVSFL